MRRPSLVLVAALACGPAVGDGEGEGNGDGETANGSSSSASPTTSGASVTDPSGVITTDDGSDDAVDSGVLFDVGGPASTTGPCEAAEPCPLPGVAFADVVGTSPVGEVVGTVAWSGVYSGECGGTGISITPTLESFAEDVECAVGFANVDPTLDVYLPSSFGTGCAIDEPVPVSHVVDGAEASTMATVEITFCEPLDGDQDTRIEGTLTVTSDGWDVSGSFVAPHCARLDIACP